MGSDDFSPDMHFCHEMMGFDAQAPDELLAANVFNFSWNPAEKWSYGRPPCICIKPESYLMPMPVRQNPSAECSLADFGIALEVPGIIEYLADELDTEMTGTNANNESFDCESSSPEEYEFVDAQEDDFEEEFVDIQFSDCESDSHFEWRFRSVCKSY